MNQSSLKLLFSFLMAFSLMAPVIAPFCAEDWYKMVMLGSNNEEETQDHQKETTKKLGEKDLFLEENIAFQLTNPEEITNQYGYLFHPQSVVSDIVLPPPERTL